MYVGMAWVRSCLIALEGEYIRLPLYGDMHATVGALIMRLSNCASKFNVKRQ